MLWWWIMASVFTAVAAKDRNLMHPTYCNLFYTVDTCPSGEHFNAVQGVCDLPQNAKCKTSHTAKPMIPKTTDGHLVGGFPHPKSCEKYYRIGVCPEDFYFNPTSNQCDYPKSKGCPACPNLLPQPDMSIRPLRCTTGLNRFDDVCTFACEKHLQAIGSTQLTCTESGWQNEEGSSDPGCVEPVAVIRNFLADLAEELEDTDAGILFVMDESGSLTAHNFKKEKIFIQGIISRYPLSENRSAGVVLFSDKARVAVSLKTRDTCSFLKQVDDMSYQGGGTNIRLALEAAKGELRNTQHNKKALILVTDGQSPNTKAAAGALKKSGARIFTFGVTGHDEKALKSIASTSLDKKKKLFYAISDTEALKDIAEYLEAEYIQTTTDMCNKNTGNTP